MKIKWLIGHSKLTKSKGINKSFKKWPSSWQSMITIIINPVLKEYALIDEKTEDRDKRDRVLNRNYI